MIGTTWLPQTSGPLVGGPHRWSLLASVSAGRPGHGDVDLNVIVGEKDAQAGDCIGGGVGGSEVAGRVSTKRK